MATTAAAPDVMKLAEANLYFPTLPSARTLRRAQANGELQTFRSPRGEVLVTKRALAQYIAQRGYPRKKKH